MSKVSYLWSKSVILALILGIVFGGVLGAVIAVADSYLGPNESDWIKYSHGWFVNIVVIGAVVIGMARAVQTALFASIVALFNIGNRCSIILQIAWLLETGIWVVIGILEIILLQRLRGELVDTEFQLDWLFMMLLGIVAGVIGLLCAANKKDKERQPLFSNPLHGLAVGLFLVPALITLTWTAIVTIVGW